MTWIKPSFLWLMARSGWARKPGQEMILAVQIARAGWEAALGLAVPADPDRRVFRDGRTAGARALLPPERPYALDPALAARIGADRAPRHHDRPAGLRMPRAGAAGCTYGTAWG